MHDDRASTVRRVRRALPALKQAAVARLQQVPWFAGLGADARSWVGMVVDAGLTSFVDWLDSPGGPTTPERVFAAVPATAARAVSLQQTVDLIRAALDAVETVTPTLAEPGDEEWLRLRVERYAREVAFAAALVYARAAEQRGAWDARLQALVVDALVAGDNERVLTARASALGWPAADPVRVVALVVPEEAPEQALAHVQRATRRLGVPALAALHGDAVLLVLASPDPDDATALRTVEQLLPGSPGAVVGPRAGSLTTAADSAVEALAGLAVLPAWRGHGRPLLAEDLLLERALAGEHAAARQLVERYHRPVAEAGGGLAETLDALLAAGGALEAAARSLPVHVNTLRYRLSRIAALTGKDPRTPRDRLTLEVAAILSRLPSHPAQVRPRR